MESVDRAEADNIRRYRRLITLRDTIDEAARRADANRRLENALRYAAPTHLTRTH
jgi:hypothetical protein